MHTAHPPVARTRRQLKELYRLKAKLTLAPPLVCGQTEDIYNVGGAVKSQRKLHPECFPLLLPKFIAALVFYRLLAREMEVRFFQC